MTARTNSGRGSKLWLPLMLVMLVLMFLASIAVGEMSLAAATESGMLRLRVIRAAVAALSGIALSMGGVWVQGFFRNDLASPSVLGTTAGATLFMQCGVLVSISFGLGSLGSIGALAGALISLVLVLAIAKRFPSTLSVLLFGFVLNAFFLAAGSFLLSFAVEEISLGRAIVRLTLGSFASASMRDLLILIVVILTASVVAFRRSGALDIMLTGELEAHTLGVSVASERTTSLMWVSLLTAAAVAAGGNIAFVGLIVPHVARSLVGLHHRQLFLMAGLMGGVFLLGCDLIARTVLEVGEVPVGVITGLFGAPFFLIVMWRRTR